MELAALERLKINLKYCNHSGAFSFDWIFFTHAGNKDIHKRLDEFEFCQIPPLITELAAPEYLKHQCLHFSSVTIDPNLFKRLCIILE